MLRTGNMLKKSVTLLTALLVTGGGFLAFESFTAKGAKAQRTRTVIVLQNGWFVANLCVKNETKNREACTGKITVGTVRDLTIPWDPGDKVLFKNNVVGGRDGQYGPLADRDTHCWSEGGLHSQKAFCRMRSEAIFGG